MIFGWIAGVEGSSPTSTFILRLIFVSVIAGGLFEAFSLLVVYLAVSIPWHDWTLLSKMTMLQLIVILSHHLCVILSAVCMLSITVLVVATQTKILKMMLLTILNWRYFLFVVVDLVDWTVVVAYMNSLLLCWIRILR